MDRWAKAGYGSRGDLRGLPCWTVFIRNGEGITQSRPMRLAPLMRPAPASWRMRAGVTSSAMAACAAVTSFTACHAGVRLRSGLAGTLCGICSGRTALGYARCSCRWPSAAQGWRKALSLSGTWSNPFARFVLVTDREAVRRRFARSPAGAIHSQSGRTARIAVRRRS